MAIFRLDTRLDEKTIYNMVHDIHKYVMYHIIYIYTILYIVYIYYIIYIVFPSNFASNLKMAIRAETCS